jgi:hypothetical protein
MCRLNFWVPVWGQVLHRYWPERAKHILKGRVLRWLKSPELEPVAMLYKKHSVMIIEEI